MSLTSYRAAPPRVGWCVIPGLEDLAATYSPASWDAVPWALGLFTAEFGMGSGGGTPPWPPGRPAQGATTHCRAWSERCGPHRTNAMGAREVLVCAVCLVEAMARAAAIILCVDDCYAWWVGRPSNMFDGTLISSLSGD